MTYEALNGLGPSFLKDHLAFQISAQPVQSSDGTCFRSDPLRKLDWWESGFGIHSPGNLLSHKCIIREAFKDINF